MNNKKVRTRFAPSPTGYMHIGNLRTALYAYLFAKHHDGTFILRIEDTDQKREVAGAVDVIYNTLKTTKLIHDEGPDVGGNFGPYVQSQRKDMYKKYALQLVDSNHAYYCFCQTPQVDDSENENVNDEDIVSSNKNIESMVGAALGSPPASGENNNSSGSTVGATIGRPQATKECVILSHSSKNIFEESKVDASILAVGVSVPDTPLCICHNLTQQEAQARANSGEPFAIRQRIPADGTTTFIDEVYGAITVANSTLNNQVLLKSDGMPTYNFANVIDDHLMEISHIIRGREYISSTPRYKLLCDAFGWESPKTIHVSTIMGQNADGSISKLSKRHGAVSFETMLQDGYLTEAILNYIALLGWSPKETQEVFSMQELISRFDIDGIVKSNSVFDYNKLNWLNAIYIKNMPHAEFMAYGQAFIKDLSPYAKNHWQLASMLAQSRISKFSEITPLFAFLDNYQDFELSLLENTKNKTTKELCKKILTDLIVEFKKLDIDKSKYNNLDLEDVYTCAPQGNSSTSNSFVGRDDPGTPSASSDENNKKNPNSTIEAGIGCPQATSRDVPQSVILTPSLNNFSEEFQTSWAIDAINAIAHAYAETHNLKLGTVMLPLRLATTSQITTPGTAAEMMFMLGKEESLRRLENVISRIQ